LTGQTIDLDTIQAIDYYRDNPLVQKAVKELAAAMPEMEVLGADANQQEALFLIDDATYLHIQSCDSGWDYTPLRCRVHERAGWRSAGYAGAFPHEGSSPDL
jgi:hypothetical protein